MDNTGNVIPCSLPPFAAAHSLVPATLPLASPALPSWGTWSLRRAEPCQGRQPPRRGIRWRLRAPSKLVHFPPKIKRNILSARGRRPVASRNARLQADPRQELTNS